MNQDYFATKSIIAKLHAEKVITNEQKQAALDMLERLHREKQASA